MPLGTLAALIAGLPRGDAELKVTADPQHRLWLDARTPDDTLRVVSMAHTFLDQVRDADPLLAAPRPHRLVLPARDLRLALDRCKFPILGGRTGGYIELLADHTQAVCYVTARGWHCSTTESVACEIAGGSVSLAVKHDQLFRAIHPLNESVVMTFQDPRKLVVISGTDDFACMLRTLGDAWPDGPTYAGSNENVRAPSPPGR